MWIVVAAWFASILSLLRVFHEDDDPATDRRDCKQRCVHRLRAPRFEVVRRFGTLIQSVLHSCLLLLNAVRLRELRRLIAAVRATWTRWRRSFRTRKSEQRRRGDVLGPASRRTSCTSRAGAWSFPELRKRSSTGEIFGEVGLFAPQQARTVTAVCEEDCRLASITRDEVLELYYENPRFGFFLIWLVAGYVRPNGNVGAAGVA